jgi:NTE family protein
MRAAAKRIRVGIILSAGGLRGVAHLGVLRQLLRHRIPMDVMVGVSAGAIIAAYYAAVGLSVEELIQETQTFRGRHIILHGLSLRAPRPLNSMLARFCGVIPRRLRQLDHVQFDRLHHGVQALGIVCHDLITNRPLYFCTGGEHTVTLAEVVKASAAIPGVIPSRAVRRGGRILRLVDGGIADSLPIEFARCDALAATHLIVSDCRSETACLACGDRMVYIRPRLEGVGVLRSRQASLVQAVAEGEAAVTDDILKQIHQWLM